MCYRQMFEKEQGWPGQPLTTTLFSALCGRLALPLWPGTRTCPLPQEACTQHTHTPKSRHYHADWNGFPCLANIYAEATILTVFHHGHIMRSQRSFNLDLRLSVIELSYLSAMSASKSPGREGLFQMMKLFWVNTKLRRLSSAQNLLRCLCCIFWQLRIQ